MEKTFKEEERDTESIEQGGRGLQGRLSRVKVGREHRRLRMNLLWSPLKGL